MITNKIKIGLKGDQTRTKKRPNNDQKGTQKDKQNILLADQNESKRHKRDQIEQKGPKS